MLIGASTRSFGGISVRKVAEIFAKNGLDCAELCFCQSDLAGWKYNLCGYEPLPSAEELLKAVDVFREYGIEVSALGVYNCFWSGSDVDIADSLRLFSEYCDLAHSCNIKNLASHGGAVNMRQLYELNDRGTVRKLYDGFVYACIEAEKRGLTVAVEYGFGDALSKSSDFALLSRYVNDSIGRSNMLKYICTPACERGTLSCGDMAMFHIKDRKTDGKYYERFGDGDCDFSSIFALAKENPNLPLIFEYINVQNIERTVREFKNMMRTY